MEKDSENNIKLTLNPGEENQGSAESEPTLQVLDSSRSAEIVEDFSAGATDESMLTDEEKRIVEEFAEKIDITNVNQVVNYGSDAQDNISEFSTDILKKVKTYDLGEIGESLKDLTVALDETVEPEKKGVLGVFKKAKKSVDEIQTNYAKAESNVDRIEKDLRKHQEVLTEDIKMYEELYSLNLKYYKQLTMYIIAGKKALAKAKDNKLIELKERAEKTNKQEDVQDYRDYEDQCYRFEKKLEILETTRIIAIQTAPQVRLLQNNDREMLDKLQTSLSNTIPLWRNQLVISLGIAHTQSALDAQKALSDKTNELLLQNSEKLKMATVGTAKEAERPIVEISTLEQCNKNLIDSINEVVKVHDEGEQQRAEVQEKLSNLESELKQAMMNSSMS